MLQGITNTELQFEMAIRDQIINSQREAQRNLWNLLMSLGLDEKQIVEHGAKQGIAVEDIKKITPLGLFHSPYYPSLSPEGREFSSRSFAVEYPKLTPSYFREEHHASYYYVSHGSSPSTNQQWCNNQPSPYFDHQPSHGFGNSFLQTRGYISPDDKSRVSSSSFTTNFRQQQQQVFQ